MLDDRTWLLIGRRMANEATPQELKELENILRSNPELHFSLQTLSDLWQQAPAEDPKELEAAYAKLLDTMNPSDRGAAVANDDSIPHPAIIKTYPAWTAHGKKVATAIAFLLIIVAAAWLLNPFGRMDSAPVTTAEVPSEISTRYGSKTNIVLPDGSKVWLNAGSKLTYDKHFGEKARDVQLTGEAYFDVVHLSGKPFVIHTKAMDIKVLGTEFNVKSYPDEKTTETSLIRGSIEVTLRDRKANRIVLKPNEKLVVSNDQQTDTVETKRKGKTQPITPLISLSTLNYFSLDSTIMETSWVDNRLVFEDESFAEIATRMTRWYGVKFNFEDNDIKTVRFTGNFKDETIEDALQAMQITADFRYHISNHIVTITKH